MRQQACIFAPMLKGLLRVQMCPLAAVNNVGNSLQQLHHNNKTRMQVVFAQVPKLVLSHLAHLHAVNADALDSCTGFVCGAVHNGNIYSTSGFQGGGSHLEEPNRIF